MTSPSGISAGAWGYSPQMVAGLNNRVEYKDYPLTYQLGLTSTPVGWNNGQNPLINANASYYSTNRFGRKNKNSFGAVKDLTREMCQEFIRGSRTVNPRTGRPIKPDGPTYKKLINDCKTLESGVPPPAPARAVRSEYSDQYERFSVVYEDCDGRDSSIKKLTLNGKVYKRGTPAFYNASKDQGVIRAMGCKQINIATSDNKEKHVNLLKFFEYNYS
jgi:hypothetical protein